MIKFIHKNQIHKHPKTKFFVIYYSLSDVILGLLLFILVAFFAYNYVYEQLFSKPPIVYISPTNRLKNSR